MRPAALFQRFRILLLALGISVALHAATIAGLPERFAQAFAVAPAARYTATLAPEVALVAPAPSAESAPAAPRPRLRAPRKPPRSGESVASLPDTPVLTPAEIGALAAAPEAAPDPDAKGVATPQPAPPLEKLAFAEPAAPIPALEPPKFRKDALPAQLTIRYALTSAFAEGVAEYSWSRDGDRYEIRGAAEATGFFTLFLEGQITQLTRGTVTASGLRPERFTERKPAGLEEGLAFDWEGRKLTFQRKDENRTAALEDDTVDWLSLIFQLAHRPPQAGPLQLKVFTQRKLYAFTLRNLGVEELQLPIGTVRALHLRHDGAKESEAVDVWLGLDQHFLPVKLRYPVARNRFMVEQVATGITSR